MSYVPFISWIRTHCFEYYTVYTSYYTNYTSYSLSESQNFQFGKCYYLSIKFAALRRQRIAGETLPWPATGNPRNYTALLHTKTSNKPDICIFDGKRLCSGRSRCGAAWVKKAISVGGRRKRDVAVLGPVSWTIAAIAKVGNCRIFWIAWGTNKKSKHFLAMESTGKENEWVSGRVGERWNIQSGDRKRLRGFKGRCRVINT